MEEDYQLEGVPKRAKGRSFVVVKRSKEWETVVDFTKMRKGGINVKHILKRLSLIRKSTNT